MATTEDDVVVRLRLKDAARFIAEVRAGRMSIDELEKKITKAGRTAARESSASGGGGFGMLSSMMKHLAFAVPMALGAAGAATATYAVKSAADLEMVQVGFETMLHSAGAAKTMVKSLQDFAAATPFRLPDVEHASQKLLAFGWTAKNIIPTLTSVGDAVAGLNLGPGGVEGVITALGQIQMKGRVQGDEILQLNERGINAQRYLMAGLHMNPQQLRKATEGNRISSDKAIPLIIKGMEKDFRGLMDKQSKTLGGIWSNFQDKAQQGLVRVVNPYLPAMKKWLNQIIAALPGYERTLSDIVGRVINAIQAGAKFARALFDWGKGVYDRARTAVDGFIQVVATALSSGDWTPVGGAVGTGMRNALQTGIAAAGGAAGGPSDWTETGKSFVPHALEFILGAVSALLDPVMWFFFLKDHIWDVALIVITVLTDGFGGALGGLGKILTHLPFGKFAGSLLIWLQKAISWLRPHLFKIGDRILGGLFDGLARVFPNVARRLLHVIIRIQDFFTSSLPGMAKTARSWVAGWFGTIGGFLAEAPWRLLKVLGKFAAWLGKTLLGILNSAATVVATAIMTILGSLFSWIKDRWDTVKGWLGFGDDHSDTIVPPPPPAPSTTVPYGGLLDNATPGMAGGGTVARSGLSWVGERGPELRYMPRGASVIPLPRAGDFAGALGGREIHTHVSVDGREILHAVHRAQDDKVARR